MSDDAERERARYEALAALVDGYRRERDDAREQLYMTKRELGRWVDRETKAARERDEARAEVERLRSWIYRTRKDTQADPNEEITDDPASLLNSMFYEIIDSRDAYRRGAEAMREACQQWCRAWENNGEAIADALADLRVEE